MRRTVLLFTRCYWIKIKYSRNPVDRAEENNILMSFSRSQPQVAAAEHANLDKSQQKPLTIVGGTQIES